MLIFATSALQMRMNKNVGSPSAHHRPPLVEVQSVLWLCPRTGDRVALLWEDKPSVVANNAHSRCRLGIVKVNFPSPLGSGVLWLCPRTPSPRDSESKLSLSSRLRRSLTCCYKTKEEKDWMLSCLKSTEYLFVCKTAVYFWQFLYKIAVLFWQIDYICTV